MSYCIYAQAAGKALTYDGQHFTSDTAPKRFATAKSAARKGRQLIRLYPILLKYRVWISAAAKVPGKKRTRGKGRRQNPSSRDTKLERARSLLVNFSGHEPDAVIESTEKPIEQGLVMGELDGVLYTARRDSKRERYIHKFRKNSRPLLVSSYDGSQLGIVGGQYQVTEAGIEDR